ncbi:uncharacterized protein LOC142546832 [Primulina tabacum]|uniref:uncharacterized protein LOC142546832 n=1 Tax=Primulina tabacum TaxID=48773 RepID=UPI003F593EBF
MRCKKHPADFSSAVGVCASCLRERLLAIMAAQAQAQLMQAQLQLAQDRGDCRKADTTHHPPSLAFPRSVSPYISRRKSDNAAAWRIHGNQDQRFCGTPQVGHTGSITVEIERGRKKSNGGRIFSLLSGLFKSKRGKTGTDASGPISDPSVSDSGPGFRARDPCTSSSPSWLSAALPNRRKKVNTFPIDVSMAGDRRRACKNRGRGMSPARFSDDEDDEHCRGGSSGYSSESSQGWRQTPRRTPASTRSGGGRAAPNKNMAGLTFCLSPLVRASPSRHRNQKGALPELMTAVAPGGDARGPPKAHLSTASSFCKNRSRKLADFGRYNPNY